MVRHGLLLLFAAACTSGPHTRRPLEQASLGIDASIPATRPPILGPLGADDGSSEHGAPPSDDLEGRVPKKAQDKSCLLPERCNTTEAARLATISLERTHCYGRCPVYRVTVDSRGNVGWRGSENVDTMAYTTRFVEFQKVRNLVEMILASCYFEMKDEYRSGVTDTPWAITTVTIGNRTKTIRHQGGEEYTAKRHECDAPPALRAIENMIDEVTRTRDWIGKGGNANTPLDMLPNNL